MINKYFQPENVFKIIMFNPGRTSNVFKPLKMLKIAGKNVEKLRYMLMVAFYIALSLILIIPDVFCEIFLRKKSRSKAKE